MFGVCTTLLYICLTARFNFSYHFRLKLSFRIGKNYEITFIVSINQYDLNDVLEPFYTYWGSLQKFTYIYEHKCENRENLNRERLTYKLIKEKHFCFINTFSRTLMLILIEFFIHFITFFPHSLYFSITLCRKM